jgi:hypothetical protein
MVAAHHEQAAGQLGYSSTNDRSAAVGSCVFGSGTATRARPLAPPPPSASERVAAFKANHMQRPQSDAARQYLLDKYGVPLSNKARPGGRVHAGGGEGTAGPQGSAAPGTTALPAGGMVARGLSPAATASFILPRSLRDDPYAEVPPQIMNLDIDKVWFLRCALLSPRW